MHLSHKEKSFKANTKELKTPVIKEKTRKTFCTAQEFMPTYRCKKAKGTIAIVILRFCRRNLVERHMFLNHRKIRLKQKGKN